MQWGKGNGERETEHDQFDSKQKTIMKIDRFEDLFVWQKAQDLAVVIYQLLEENRDWKFKGQICDAVVSISNNIAEGFEQPTTVNYIRYLNIARTSNNEVKSMSYLAPRLGYFSNERQKHILSECEAISKMLRSMIEKLEAKIERDGPRKPKA